MVQLSALLSKYSELGFPLRRQKGGNGSPEKPRAIFTCKLSESKTNKPEGMAEIHVLIRRVQFQCFQKAIQYFLVLKYVLNIQNVYILDVIISFLRVYSMEKNPKMDGEVQTLM